MHEREKLKEASHFALCMERSINDPESFQYELSAFLSAARSVLQYALEEAKQKQNGQQWYDNQVSGNAILRYFKDKRDLNIHTEPIRTSRHIEVSEILSVNISESVRIEITNADGTKENRKSVENPNESIPVGAVSKAEISYVFTDWTGPEDVIQLSRQYLIALEAFVKSGIGSGYISG